MKKETLIAIILGLILGGSVATTVVLLSKPKIPDTVISPVAPIVSMTAATSGALLIPETSRNNIISTTAAQQVAVGTLEITTPTAGSHVQTKSITIHGTTTPGMLVVAQSPARTVVEKPETEKFSLDFPLAIGENVILINAFAKGNTTPVQRELVVYRIE